MFITGWASKLMNAQWDNATDHLLNSPHSQEATQSPLALYEEERRRRTQRTLNIACLLAMILVPAFGLVDYVVAPHKLSSLLSIRFVCSLNLLALYLLNRTTLGKRFANYFAIYGAVSVSAFMALMTYVLGGPKSPYYAGISLVLIVAGLIIPMTVWEGIIMCSLIYLSYLLLSSPFLHGENLIFFTGDSFHIMATMVVVLVGFRLKERLTLQEIQRRLQLSEMGRRLEMHAKHLEEKIRQQTINIIQALAYAIEAKDPYTRGHSERVRSYAQALAQQLRLSEHDNLLIGHAAILHDIGKVKISGQIIQKPNPLTESEYLDMKEHPILGESIIQGISFLEEAKPLIRHHHERWDGKGYPEGLKGEEIPLGSRIIAIADVYDALTFRRPYREGATKEEAIHLLRSEKGRSLDPHLVEAFVGLLKHPPGLTALG